MPWDGNRLPDAMLSGANAAVTAAAAGTKNAAYWSYLQGQIGSNYLRQLYRDDTKVWEATVTGTLPIVNGSLVLPAIAAQTQISAADIDTGVWAHYIRNATDPTKYIATGVTNSAGIGPAKLSGDLAAGVPITLGSFVLNSTLSDTTTLSSLSASNIAANSVTLSVVVGGQFPAGALMLLQVTEDAANGPWRESPKPTLAAVGTLTWNVTGLTAGRLHYYRAFVYSEPGGGQATIIHAQSATSTFSTTSTSQTTEIFLPIGDSLTNGDTSPTPIFYSWLGRFQELLVAAGRPFDMVGPRSDGLGIGADAQHAAWGGMALNATTNPNNNFVDRIPVIFTASTNPTVGIFYLGWNEMWLQSTQDNAAANWTAAFNAARAQRPSMKWLVPTLHLPSDGTRRSGQNSINSAIRAAAAANPSTVRCVDFDAQLNLLPADYADYLHFSQSGASKAAQMIFDSLVSANWGSAVDEMVAQMGANPPGATPTLLPAGAGWDTGGRVCIGGDVRGVAKPTWWMSVIPPQTAALVSGYPWWDFIFPWYEIWDIDGHLAGLNARVVVDWIEGWVLYDDVAGWQRFGRAEGAQLYTANDDAGAFYQRGNTGTAFGTKDLINGALHISVVPYGRMFHGWGAAAQCRGEHIVRLHTRCQVRLALANPNGTDDRHLVKCAAHVGCDPYPSGGAGLGMPPYNPGNGVSRWEIVTNTPKVLYWSNIDAPACQSVDESYPYNFRQTVTEAEFRANPPPLP